MLAVPARVDRRSFLSLTGAALSAAPFHALAGRVAAAAGQAPAGARTRDEAGYGPLRAVRDETTGLPLLHLPAGFRYLSFGWTGDPLADGRPTPGLHDGMAAFAAAGSRIRLVRNHEITHGRGLCGPPSLRCARRRRDDHHRVRCGDRDGPRRVDQPGGHRGQLRRRPDSLGLVADLRGDRPRPGRRSLLAGVAAPAVHRPGLRAAARVRLRGPGRRHGDGGAVPGDGSVRPRSGVHRSADRHRLRDGGPGNLGVLSVPAEPARRALRRRAPRDARHRRQAGSRPADRAVAGRLAAGDLGAHPGSRPGRDRRGQPVPAGPRRGRSGLRAARRDLVRRRPDLHRVDHRRRGRGRPGLGVRPGRRAAAAHLRVAGPGRARHARQPVREPARRSGALRGRRHRQLRPGPHRWTARSSPSPGTTSSSTGSATASPATSAPASSPAPPTARTAAGCSSTPSHRGSRSR